MLDLAPYRDSLAAFARRWRVTELALFGSALRDDFGPESDIDLLVTFDPEAPWSLFDIAAMKLELEDLFGRSVDLVEEKALRNPYRRRAILNSSQRLYAA